MIRAMPRPPRRSSAPILLIALIPLACADTRQRQVTTQPAVAATTRSTTAPTTKPKTPVPETLTIELGTDYGPFRPMAKGLHRLTPPSRPNSQMLESLKPLLDQPTPTLITLGNTVKFDGAFPGEKGNWSKWDQGVRDEIRKYQGKAVHYEIWDEPDRQYSFRGSREDYFSAWVHTTNLIRSIDPAAVLIGPSSSKYDFGYVQEFLKMCKDYHAPASIVCWHEEGAKPDVAGHYDGIGESFWQDGTWRPYVRVLQKSADAQKFYPGDVPIILHPVHSGHRRIAWRGVGQDFAFKLTHLVTEKSEPRSLYYAWAAYAALDAPGNREAKVTAANTTDALAVWNHEQKRGSALIGRSFNRVGSAYLPGQVTLSLKGLTGPAVRVESRLIKDSGKDASPGPLAVTPSELPVVKGEAKLLLADFANHDACVVTFTALSTPTTTTSKPSTTQSTPK
jgi:hypothetical protein